MLVACPSGVPATLEEAEKFVKLILPRLRPPKFPFDTIQMLFVQRYGCWDFVNVFYTDVLRTSEIHPERFTLEYHGKCWRIVSRPLEVQEDG